MPDLPYESGIDPKKESSWKKLSTVKKLLFLLLIIGVIISITWLIIFFAVAISQDTNEPTSNDIDAPAELRKYPGDVLQDASNNEANDDNFIVDSCNEICNSSTCFEKANFYLENMNPDVDPCDDFYQFACGNFIKNTPIPADENKISPIKIIQKKVYSELIREMEKKINPAEPSAFRKTKKFYQNCINEPLIQEKGTQIFLEVLSDVGSMPVLVGNSWKEEDFTWIETILKFYDYGYPPSLPGALQIIYDQKNSTKKFISVRNAETKISQYFVTDGPNNKVLKAYYRYMVDIAVMLGATKYNALNEMTECLKFELALYHIKSSTEELSNTSKTYNLFTIKQLSEKHPTIPWLEFFKRIFEQSNVNIDDDETVNLIDPKFIGKLENLIARTPKRVIANYIFWQVIYNSIDYLPNEFLDRQLIFEKVLKGVKERKPRAYSCLDEVMVIFETSVSSMYARKYFNTAFRRNALGLVENIKNQFRKTLNEADWMDDETRSAAQEKLAAMTVFVAYRDEFFNDSKLNEHYDSLEINTDDYLSAAVNVSRFYLNQHFKNLRKPDDFEDWTSHKNTALVNAFYLIQRNAIELPAGILQGVFYDAYRPSYLNYGAIGSIIGHEMTHSFDNEGRKADKDGNHVDWWQPETKEKYLEKANCFVEQYGNYTVEEVGLKIKGKLTLGENIADNGGFKVAYKAYNEWTRKNGKSESCLPGLNYTPRQMFWISAANNWCSKYKPEALKSAVLADFHSLPEARVTQSFSNLKEFSRDFECKLGTRMNPENKCTVW